MGRAVYISVRTKCTVYRSQLRASKRGESFWMDYLDKVLYKAGVYDKAMTDSTITYSLNKELVEKEWVAFLREFYNMIYLDTNLKGELKETNRIIADLEARNSFDEYMSLSKKNDYSYYYYDYCEETDYLEYKMDNVVQRDLEEIRLSLDGKIVMPEEGWNVIHYFQRAMRERMSSYKLAESLIMSVTL